MAFGFGVAFGAVVAGRLGAGLEAVEFGLDVDVSTPVVEGGTGLDPGADELALEPETILEFESVELFVSTAASIVGAGVGEASIVGAGEGVGSATAVAP